MEVSGEAGARGGAGGGGGGGGPAPFLLKTYEMVDDPSTDAVVSWSDASDASFVVWNSPEFAARLLPTYFKHSNFSSFIRQLNTYGFRKVDPERWEFANEYFVKGQKQLLKNIYRRKPIHSHSHQPGALPDNERAFFEDEIDRLAREKANLQAEVWKFKQQQQQSGTLFQIEDVEQRVLDMEQRQGKMIAFLQQASKNPHFVNKLVKMAEASPIFTDVFHKKRRLSGLDHAATEATETSSFCEDHSTTTSKQDMGNLLNQHFSDKLKLGLCPAMAESNLISLSTQSSHEDNGSPHGKHPSMGTECLPLVPQTMELSDTGTSIFPGSKDSCFTPPAANEEELFPCHLSLTLASCSMDVDRDQVSNADVSTTADQGSENLPEASVGGNQKTSADAGTADATPLRRDATEFAPAAPPAVVNDKFWEQFLTERPGCETEDAGSGLSKDPPMDKGQAEGNRKDDREDMEQALKL